MPASAIFWMIMILWFLFGLWWGWRMDPAQRFPVVGGNLIVFVLLFLLGWKVFGFVIQ